VQALPAFFVCWIRNIGVLSLHKVKHRCLSASRMMFSQAEMMFGTAFQNDVVSLQTQTQAKKEPFGSFFCLELVIGLEPTAY